MSTRDHKTMTAPSTKVVTPRRGTIASRYLEAISSGGNEDIFSKLSIQNPHRTNIDSNQVGNIDTPPPAAATSNSERQSRTFGRPVTPTSYFIHGADNHTLPLATNDGGTKPPSADCSMTASTATLNQSESWTTTGTKSQKTSRPASRSGTPTRGSGTPSRRRWTSTNNGGTIPSTTAPVDTPPTTPTNGGRSNMSSSSSNRRKTRAGSNQYRPPPGTSTAATSIMGIEDDDSSIESASTHGKNTPAHLSIEIGETANLADLTVNALDCSSLYMGSAADGGSSSRSHRSSPARLATPSSHSASSRGSGKRSLSVFPRTKPSTSAVEARPVTPNKKGTNLCTPYGLKRTAAPAAAAGSLTTPSYNDGALGHRKRGEDEVGVLPSDAGAPTEVMTNRTTDIMTRLRQNMIDRGEERSEHPQQRGQQQLQWGGVSARKSMFEVDGGVPPPPPSVKRKGWLPGENGVGDAASATRAKASPSKTRLTSVGSTATTALHSLNQIDCNHSSQIEKDHKHDDGILPSLLDSHSTASYSLNETEVKTRGGSGGPRLSISAHARTPLAWNAASRESGIRRDGFAPAPIPQSTRLSKHVQKARQQSILSPSASETTASLHSINGVSSVNVEPSLQSGPLGDRDVTQSQPRGSTSNSLLPGLF